MLRYPSVVNDMLNYMLGLLCEKYFVPRSVPRCQFLPNLYDDNVRKQSTLKTVLRINEKGFERVLYYTNLFIGVLLVSSSTSTSSSVVAK